MFIFYALLLFSLLDKVLQWLFQTGFFSFGGQKKWLLVALDKWSSYAVTIVWELAWVASALVVLDQGSSYRAGRLSRFDCTNILHVDSLTINIPCHIETSQLIYIANQLTGFYMMATLALNGLKRKAIMMLRSQTSSIS